MCQYPNPFFWSLFRHYSAKMLANTKVFAPLFACTDEKSNQKNLKDSKSLKIRIFQGVRAQTYWRISSPTTQKKTIFSLFERVRILTHLPRHNRLEHMRPMLVKFPLSCFFGICKATALLHPARTSEQKFSGALGLRVQKEQIFCKKRQKRS